MLGGVFGGGGDERVEEFDDVAGEFFGVVGVVFFGGGDFLEGGVGHGADELVGVGAVGLGVGLDDVESFFGLAGELVGLDAVAEKGFLLGGSELGFFGVEFGEAVEGKVGLFDDGVEGGGGFDEPDVEAVGFGAGEGFGGRRRRAGGRGG